MPTFVGAGLSLESVVQETPATIRVKFTQVPLAVSSSGAHDALNSANYTVTGPPGIPAISSVNVVGGDNQSFDLYFPAPLPSGTYTIAVANIQTAGGASLQAPTSLVLVITSSGGFEPVNGGAENDAAFDVLLKFFNPALRGDAWEALLYGVAAGEQFNWDNAQAAFNQLFLATASGDYLVQRASDQGVNKPAGFEMSDDLFRKYALTVTNNQLTEEAFLEVLEVFYGQDSVRAFSVSSTTEPYALTDGDDFTVLVDEKLSVTTVFSSGSFAQIGRATAIEVAIALTQSFASSQTKAFAIPVLDSTTGKNKVKIYSPSRGLKSSVRITGGKAQNVLQFPTLLSLPGNQGNPFPTWNITLNTATGIARFSTTGATNLDLSGLQIGDYVNIYGSEFNSANRGSFVVTNVSITYSGATETQYFEFVNPAASVQTVTQAGASSILYFRPTRATVHTAKNRAVTVSIPGDFANISVPATSQAVSRKSLSAAYGQGVAPLAITSLSRTAGVVTAVVLGHGLVPGGWILVEGAVGSITSAGDLNGIRQVVTVVDANTFTFKTPATSTASTATGGTVTPFAAPKSTIPGPYIFDYASTAAITGKGSGLLQDIGAGQQYASLSVVDATQFPDAPGYLVVAFGYDNQCSPVPYLGRQSATSLILDYSYVFPNAVTGGPVVAITAGGGSGSTTLTVSALPQALPTNTALQLSGGASGPEIVYTAAYVASGGTSIPLASAIVNAGRTSARAALTNVSYLAQKGAYIPTNPETVGAFYLTDSPAGRTAALAAVDSIAAAGLSLKSEVVYPGDAGLPRAGTSSSEIVDIFSEED